MWQHLVQINQILDTADYIQKTRNKPRIECLKIASRIVKK